MKPPTPTLFAAREGFEAPTAESFYQRPWITLHIGGFDLAINRTVLIIFGATVLIGLLFTIGTRGGKLVPRGLQNVIEFGVDFVRNQIVIPVMGTRGLPFLPYLTTLFFFILFLNWSGVIPGVNFPATSRIGIPLVLAMFTWVVFLFQGFKHQGGAGYLRNTLFPPGVPVAMYVLLTPIEIISVFVVRPASLAIRLVANMIAGHLMLGVFFLGSAYLLAEGKTIVFGVLAVATSTALLGFEIFVGGLQAYIFTMLTAVYIAGSQESAH